LAFRPGTAYDDSWTSRPFILALPMTIPVVDNEVKKYSLARGIFSVENTSAWKGLINTHYYLLLGFEEAYGKDPVWVPYRRNYKGRIMPETRKTCIVSLFSSIT
jgi:hypothetical protein